MDQTASLELVQSYDVEHVLQDLMYAFNDGVIDRIARCVKSEVRPWMNRAWLAAAAGVPIMPALKRQLLKELYELRYKLFHEPGAKAYVTDAIDISWPEDNRVLRHRNQCTNGLTILNVLYSRRAKWPLTLPAVNPFVRINILLNFPMPNTAPAMIAAPAPAIPNVPVGISLHLARALVPTTGPHAVPPLPAPLTHPTLPASPPDEDETPAYPQRNIAGVKRNKKGQLMKGGYKRR